MTTKKTLLSGILGLLTLSTLGAVAWTSTHSYGRQPAVKSQTDTIEVVEKVAGEGATKVRVRNASKKSINALQISVGGSVFMVEFLDADEPKRSLKPGGFYEEWFPIPNASDVSILAVIFEDRTGDGDERLVKEVLETRRGVKKQLAKFGIQLKQTLTSATVDLTELEKLNGQLDGPIDEDLSDSGGVRLGQRKARQQIRHDLQALKRQHIRDPNFDIRSGLTTIQRRHDQRLAEIE